MAPSTPVPYLRRLRRATVRVFNETPWPAVLRLPGRSAPGVALAPGDDVTIGVPLAATAVEIACHGRRRTYALDLGLLGFDTVHLRAADLTPACAG